MSFVTTLVCRYRTSLLLAALTITVVLSHVGRTQAQSTAQIGTASPLPVHVTNSTMLLPEGFAPGTHWRFTTWTTPSVFTWTTTVNKTSGPWANLTVRNEDGTSSTRWYYIPGMPGSWDRQ